MKLASRIFVCLIILSVLLSGRIGTITVGGAEAARNPMTRSAAQQAASGVVLYRGDGHRTGAYDEPGIGSLTGTLWQVPVGAITHGPPVFANGLVYLMGDDGRLAAIDAVTGNRVWSFKAKPPTPLFSSVAVANGVLYVGQDSRVWALDAMTGQKLWKAKAGGLVLPGPLVAGSTLYYCSFDDNLYAVDTNTAERKWKHRIGDSDTPPVFDDGTIYTSAQDSAANRSFVFALDAETGEEKWRNEQPFSTGWQNGIAFADGLLYAGNGDGHLYALDSRTGNIVWGFQAGDSWSRPAVAEGIVYVGNQDQYLYTLKADSGELLWKFHADAAILADPIVAGGVVYFGVGTLDASLDPRPFYALDMQSGNLLWKFQADSRIRAGAAIGNGAVYVATDSGTSGTLYALH